MSRALLAALLAAALGRAFAADPLPPGAERVTVQMTHPEKFTDFKATCVAWTSARAACSTILRGSFARAPRATGPTPRASGSTSA